jgi:hypothetical protein
MPRWVIVGGVTADEIIAYMESHGWQFMENREGHGKGRLNVTFSRGDWHGQPTKIPVFVSRYGGLDERYELVRDAGREALDLWRRFPKEPARFFDPEAREIVWK